MVCAFFWLGEPLGRQAVCLVLVPRPSGCGGVLWLQGWPRSCSTIGNTSTSSSPSLPLCWLDPIAMSCLVQKITAHVGSNLMLHYPAVNHLPHDLTPIFFFNESLSC